MGVSNMTVVRLHYPILTALDTVSGIHKLELPLVFDLLLFDLFCTCRSIEQVHFAPESRAFYPVSVRKINRSVTAAETHVWTPE
jgi:hypothetical protein